MYQNLFLAGFFGVLFLAGFFGVLFLKAVYFGSLFPLNQLAFSRLVLFLKAVYFGFLFWELSQEEECFLTLFLHFMEISQEEECFNTFSFYASLDHFISRHSAIR